jgi:hypothetical protein
MLVSQMTDAERKIYNQGKRDERKRVYNLIADRTYSNSGENKCDDFYHITLACTDTGRGWGSIICLCEFKYLIGYGRKKR